MQARGAVIGALSTTSTEFPVPVELQDALGLTAKRPETVWKKRNSEYSSYAQGLIPIEVPPQFSVAEAATLVEVWNHAGALHSGETQLVLLPRTCTRGAYMFVIEIALLPSSDLNDSVFLAKLAETGGNPRQFLHRGYMSSLVAW
jgi:small subunit ribosomal protein S29